jgi:hypothetical protein
MFVGVLWVVDHCAGYNMLLWKNMVWYVAIWFGMVSVMVWHYYILICSGMMRVGVHVVKTKQKEQHPGFQRGPPP